MAELNSDESERIRPSEKSRRSSPHDDPYVEIHCYFDDEPIWLQFEATSGTIQVRLRLRQAYCQKDGRGWKAITSAYAAGHADFKHSFRCFRARVWSPCEKTNPQLWKGNRHRNLYQRAVWVHLQRFLDSYKDGLKYFSGYLWRTSSSDDANLGVFSLCRLRSLPNNVPFAESFGGWSPAISRIPIALIIVYYVGTAHEGSLTSGGTSDHAKTYNRGAEFKLLGGFSCSSAWILSDESTARKIWSDYLRWHWIVTSAEAAKRAKRKMFLQCIGPYQWYNKGSLILYGLKI